MATCACCLTQMTSSFHDCIRQISATEGSKDSPANLLIHLKSYFNTKFDKKNKWRPFKLIDKCLQTDYLCIAESWFWTSSFSSLSVASAVRWASHWFPSARLSEQENTRDGLSGRGGRGRVTHEWCTYWARNYYFPWVAWNWVKKLRSPVFCGWTNPKLITQFHATNGK